MKKRLPLFSKHLKKNRVQLEMFWLLRMKRLTVVVSAGVSIMVNGFSKCQSNCFIDLVSRSGAQTHLDGILLTAKTPPCFCKPNQEGIRFQFCATNTSTSDLQRHLVHLQGSGALVSLFSFSLHPLLLAVS